MERFQRHRYALALPFLLFALIAVVGGPLNGATATGRLLDDYTGDPVKDGEISVGKRTTWSGEDGSYRLPNVPRTTALRVNAGGYFLVAAPPEGGDIRLAPNSIAVQVNIEGADPVQGVPMAQIREGTRVLATANSTGGANVAPHPGREATLLFCAKGFRSKELRPRGVALFVTLTRDEAGDCPPLPSPSPAPGASPSPAAPAASPSPAAPSPSPTGR